MKLKFHSWLIAFVMAIGISFSSLTPTALAQEKIKFESEEAADKAVERLAKDKRFQRLMDLNYERASKLRDYVSKKTPEELIVMRRDLVELKSMISSAKALKDLVNNRRYKYFVDLGGVDGIHEDAEEIDRLRDALVKDHPVFQSRSGVGQTLDSGFYRSEYNLRPYDPDKECDEGCECLRACEEEYRQAWNAYVFDITIGWITTFPNPLGMLESTIGEMIENIDLRQELLECKRDCGVFDDDYHCQSDSVCEDGEYCSNPIGNPYNRCVPKKAEGKTCTRGGQCASGCCKYHAWTHPLHPVCRPANKCN